MSDTPIYNQLTMEFQSAGRQLPWMISFKPRGTIRVLNAQTEGIHWAPARSYLRDYLIEQRYGMMVCNGKDNCPACGLFYAAP